MDGEVCIDVKGGRRGMLEAGYGCWDTSKHSSINNNSIFFFLEQQISIEQFPNASSNLLPSFQRHHRRE